VTDAATASSARKLAVFLDGTWDRAIGNTNVWRLKSLCRNDQNQLIFYSKGVGTSIGEKIRGGIFGYGIDDQLTRAYQLLVENYHDGDELFLFGFSRGAFAARSLSGLVSRCGVLKARRSLVNRPAVYPLPERRPRADYPRASKQCMPNY
jgi:uncharacterized protein (DUF2235 family)